MAIDVGQAPTVISTQFEIQKNAATHWMPDFCGMTRTFKSNH